MTHPYFADVPFLAFAHRGGAEEAPENTMAAFEAAVNLGYRYIETDAWATRDGTLLSFHDNVLDRVTDRAGTVEEMLYADVREARIAGTETIPLLEELLGTWPDLRINIDPKHDLAVEPLISAIKRTNAVDRVCVGSFSGERLDRMRAAFGGKLCTSASPSEVFKLRANAWAGSSFGRFDSFCVQVPIKFRQLTVVNQAFMVAAAKYGLQVHVWTIDEPDEMKRLIDLGVHGLMTDRPSVLKDVLVEKGLWM